jgi:peptidyl-prolyl cis-trans isomerase A (cyclophilin A)
MSVPVSRRHLLGGAGLLVSGPALAGRMLPGRRLPAVRFVLESGRIDIELEAARAPLSSDDFLRYVDGHFYDDGRFTRTVRADNDHGAARIDVVQGGVRPGVTPMAPIAHESTQMTGLKHLDGVISLPRDKVGTGSGAEFFICIGDQPALDFGGRRNADGQGFAAFGRVIAGMDLVRSIWRADASGPSPDTYTQGQMLRQPVRILSATRI